MALSLNVQNLPERIVFVFGVGAACLSLLVFALCAFNWATVPLLVGAVVVVALAAVAFASRFAMPSAAPTPRIWLLIFAAVALPFTVLYLVNAAAPEISPDGSGYHLGLVRQYLNHQGFYHITTNLYANFPQGCEMLFLPAYAVGRHSAAALVHFAFFLAVPLALIAYGRRFSMPVAGVIAALLFYVAPVAGIDGTSAYVDMALTLSGFLCFYALEIWRDHLEPKWLVIAGIMAGFAFATKYTGVVVFVYSVGYLLLNRARVKQLAILATPAALLAFPWLVKNYVTVANPFSPFFNRWFPNPYIDPSFEDAYRTGMRHFNGASLDLSTPLEVTIRGGLLQGAIGPLFLIAPLALFLLSEARGRRIWAAVFLFEMPWLFNIGTRFLLPALPLLALAIGMTLAKRPKIATAAVLANALLCWPQIFALYSASSAWRIQRFPLAAALRITPERTWLEANAPEIRFAWMLQHHAPPNAVIYTAQPIMEAYTDRTILLNYTSAFNTRIEAMVKTPVEPMLAPTSRHTYRFQPPNTSNIELAADTEGPMILWLEGPGHFEAWPVQRGEPRRITIDPQTDRVILRSQESTSPHLRITANGRTIVYEESIEHNVAPPDLRTTAIREIRRLGITHLAIHDLEPLGPDIARDPARWHLRAIAAAPPLRLYEITLE